MRRFIILFWVVLMAVVFGLDSADGQMMPYSDYFRQNTQQSRTRPYVSPGRYTYDRMFYRNPAVSPYSNLLRPSGEYTNNYFHYVRPELKRRSIQSQPPSRFNSPRTSAVPRNNPYVNQYFSNRSALGLK